MQEVAEQKQDFSKILVTMVIIMNILFTIAVLYVFMHVGYEPSSLVVAWFAFTTGELWFLSGIKKKKIDQEREEKIRYGPRI